MEITAYDLGNGYYIQSTYYPKNKNIGKPCYKNILLKGMNCIAMNYGHDLTDLLEIQERSTTFNDLSQVNQMFF